MQYTPSTTVRNAIDAVALADELKTICGTNYGISTAGNTVTANALFADAQAEALFKTVIDDHVLPVNIAARALKKVKADREDVIRAAFDIDSNKNVVVAGVSYNGGIDSASKLDGAKRLAQLANQTVVTFFDINNVGHALAFVDADTVILAVAGAYQTAFARKQTAMVAIANAPDEASVALINY